MRHVKKILWMIVAAIFLAWPLTAHAKVPAVVAHIPGDAQVFITIPSLSKLSNKVAIINQKLGLNQPQMNNVLSLVKAMGGLTTGIDDDGGAALVITSLPLPQDGGAGRGRMPALPKGLLLLPVKDYGAFVGNFGVRDTAPGAVDSFKFMKTPVFAKHVGDFAVISNNRQQVAKYVLPSGSDAALADTGHFGKQILTHSDISFYANIVRVGPIFRTIVSQQMGQVARTFRRMGAGAQMSGMMNAYLKIYGNIIDAFLRDGQVVATGIDISNGGVGLSYVAQFKKNSNIARMFVKNPAIAPSLNRLPDQPYLLAMNMDTSTLPVKQWCNDIVTALGQASGWRDLFTGTEQLINASGNEWQTVVFAPKPGASGMPEFTNGIWVASTQDPEAFVNAYQQLIAGLNNVDSGVLSYHTTFQREARQIADRDIAQYTIQIKASERLARQLGPNQQMLQGQNGLLFHVDDAVVAAVNVDDAIIADAIIAAGGHGKLDQNEGIVIARNRLPKSNLGQMYLNVGTFIETIGAFTGMPVRSGQFANLPPIAAAVGVQNGSIGTRAYVPMSVITAIKNVATSSGLGIPIAAARPR